ncbi:MAG: ATP-dependent RecD-like DNA helicase [Clostridiales bacterium]|nr:ATP-dependent RecD-like DNA helicase [Clostridiales bacterium]
MRGQKQVELFGTVESITYRNETNGYTVLDLSSQGELVTVVGNFPALACGEELRLLGFWTKHSSYGRQFKAEELIQRSLPSTTADLLKYLSSGVIKGVGPATATKIVESFGEETFNVLENDPMRLSTVKGISLNKAKNIIDSFNKQFALREVMMALERYGMSPTEVMKTYAAFGADSVEMVKDNPYILCEELVGLDFVRVDSLAELIAGTSDAGQRNASGIKYIVKHNLSNGHTCLPREKLVGPAQALLGINEEETQAALDFLIENKALVERHLSGRAFVFLPDIYLAERSIADHFKIMLRFPPAGRETLDAEIKRIEIKQGFDFAQKQRLAIKTAVEKGILILTGGPGTGKTTTINGIVKMFEICGYDVALTAPTGRAAKRMSELTGREAKTIHRLLEVEWDKDDNQIFARNSANPLRENAVIVDELSMVDVTIFANLMSALPLGCRLVMVGDYDQLPPVGAGNVLQDLIASEHLPVVQLNEIFRQAMESLIVQNAHKIVQGKAPQLDIKDKDFFFIERSNIYDAAAEVCNLCAKRLPAAYGYSPTSDIQILTPSRKGETGTANLNSLLQNALNPAAKGKAEIIVAGKTLRRGDKVMQVKNNYDISWTRGREEGLGVFNGDVGILESIDRKSQSLEVIFDDRLAVYSFEEAADLEMAYAMTVHKSQGNEFEAVIMPVIGLVPQLAYRNLLYTAVTRAKQILILVGSSGQIMQMVANDKKARRYSALSHFMNWD